MDTIDLTVPGFLSFIMGDASDTIFAIENAY